MSEKWLANWNVIALGSRDHYEVAHALHRIGRLNRLITDYYQPDVLSSITDSRRRGNLSSKITLSLLPWTAFSKLIPSQKFPRTRYWLVDWAFGFISAALTWRAGASAIVYSYFLPGFVAFYKVIRCRPPNLICFQVHPTSLYAKVLLREDSVNFSQYREARFIKDGEEFEQEQDHVRLSNAITASDAVLCASNFTLRTVEALQKAPVSGFVVAYGSRIERARDKQGEAKPTLITKQCSKLAKQRIKLLTVGQLSQRKGIHWAFLAMTMAITRRPELDFEWVVVSYRRDPAIEEAAPSNVRFRDFCSLDELHDLYRESDLFVLPSLVEGFGLVYLEAMSFGTPIIYSHNTGPADICQHKQHGFLVNPQDPLALSILFEEVFDNPELVRSMREDCQRLSRQFSWERFREGIVSALHSVEDISMRSPHVPTA